MLPVWCCGPWDCFQPDRRQKQLLNQKIEVEWASHQWYKGTVKLYDSYTGKYTVQYDDGEVVALDPCQGRPRKELPYRMCLIQNEMNEQEAAQNVLEQTRKVFRFLQDSQRSSYDPKGKGGYDWGCSLPRNPTDYH